MPRIKQYAQKYATDDLMHEIRIRMAHLDLRYLALAAGMSKTTLCDKFKDLNSLTVVQLQRLIAVLTPNPKVVLRWLGYSDKQIRDWISQETASKEGSA